MAYLMMVEPSKEKHVIRQTSENGLEKEFSEIIQNIYTKYHNEFEQNFLLKEENEIISWPWSLYDKQIYNHFNLLMKSELGFGIDMLMRVARVTLQKTVHKYDFFIEYYGIREDDWDEYYVQQDYTHNLMRAESDEEVLLMWLNKFEAYNN